MGSSGLPQIWNGPALPETAAQWKDDAEVTRLVEEIRPRRVPLEEAQEKIRNFASSLSTDDEKKRLFMLVRGLFDRMDSERSDVMSGIERFARKQATFAQTLRSEAAEADRLRNDSSVDEEAIKERDRQLQFQTRLFQERAHSLTYVCEVPTTIEQRLYRLAGTITELTAQSD